MKKSLILCALAASLMAVGCLNKDESEASVTTPTSDVSEVSISADFIAEEKDNMKVVRITANRSFSAHLNDLDNPVPMGEPVPWANLKESGFNNLSNTTQESDVVILFNRNWTAVPNRGVLEIYSEGKKVLTINVNQLGAVFKLSATASVKEVSSEGEDITLNIDCNTYWSVKAADDATAEVRLDETTGLDQGVLNVRVLENEEAVAKKVKLIVSAQDCPDVTIELNQPATKGEVKFWQVYATLKEGGSGTTLHPNLVIDKDKIDPDAVSAGAKFYYEYSLSGFDDIGTPTAESAEFTEDGLNFLPKTIAKFTTAYVKILGTAPGYRDTYTYAIIRNWQFGTNYILDSSNGLEFTKGAENKSTYYVYWYLNLPYTATTLTKGTGAYYCAFHCTNTSYPRITLDGTEVHNWSIPANTGVKAAPASFVKDIPEFNAGAKVGFYHTKTNPKKYTDINFLTWSIDLLEQHRERL